MKSIAYFPVVNDEDQLIDLLSRAAWFLCSCPINRIYIPIASEKLKTVEWRVAPGMDNAISANFDRLEAKVTFVVVETESDMDAFMVESEIILRWKKDFIPEFITAKKLAQWENGKKILQVDPVAVAQEGGFYIDVSYSLMKDRTNTISENNRKFSELSSRLKKFERAYLLATGPSISNYRYLDFEKSIGIVCNSVILDDELMETVRPQILVFADPIFHFGPSQYAGAFRQRLYESAKKYDFKICIPLKYYPLFISVVPELADRTIGIPFVQGRPWNFDLNREFIVRTTANILTFLMIPLAATFADEICILGCDGRPLNENTYFWNHNPNTQINDKMANIREVHPGFFNIEYNDYYLQHCETLAEQLSEGENAGKRFLSVGFSHIPALNCRIERGKRICNDRIDGRKPDTAFIILPGINREGERHTYIGLQKALIQLGVRTQTVEYSSAIDAMHLSEKIEQALISDNSISLVFIPRATLTIVNQFAPLLARHNRLRFHIDLSEIIDEISDKPNSRDSDMLSWLNISEPRIVCSIESAAARAKLSELTGLIFHIEPQHPIPLDDESQVSEWREYAIWLLRDQPCAITYPRILVIDLTNMGGMAATSRIKETFFGTWPEEKFALVCMEGGIKKHLAFCNKAGGRLAADIGNDEVMNAVKQYAPEVLYYRAVDEVLVHDFALRLATSISIPFVVHLMDDWPERLKSTNSNQFSYFDQTLRAMLKIASERLSIGDDMANAFKDRYGLEFKSFANSIDPASYPPRHNINIPGETFVIRYTGALAQDMTLQSICDVADVVEELSAEINIRLEIYTRPPWKGVAQEKFARLKSVVVLDQVPASDYVDLLQGANALLIAYNFDKQSQTYVGYSIANKLPEYLASGTPILAYGPPTAATIAYLRRRGCVQLMDNPDRRNLLDKVRQLAVSQELQERLGTAARNCAFVHHNVWNIANDLHRLLSDAVNTSSSILLGPYSRRDTMHWDETNCVSELFEKTLSGKTMIDVGAHHGTALIPFLNKEWKIFAFEPDKINRSHLLERLGRHKNKELVILDHRCVSNSSQNEVPFYCSDQSSGISGLSAFHTSHVEAQRVDTITLTDFFRDKPLPEIDFLKIDTEGHDLFVLQGFPWERGTPAVIECEFEDIKTIPLGYTFHDLARFLVDKGYNVYVSEWHPVIRYGIRHDWNRLVRYPCELKDSKAWGNLLAFREPIDEAELVAAVHKVLKSNTAGNKENVSRLASSAETGSATKSLGQHNYNFPKLPITFSMKQTLFYSYAHFAEWLRDYHPNLFTLGQFIIRCIRFLKRNVLAALGVAAVLLTIVASQLRTSSWASYETYFWLAAGLLTFAVSVAMGAAAVRRRINSFVEKEHLARQSVKSELIRELSQLAARQEEFAAKQEQFASKQEQLVTKQQQLATNPIFNIDDYQPFNRRLKKEHTDILIKDWSEKLDLKISHRSLAYLAHRICMLEQLSKGRLATPIENAVLRVLVASAVKDKNLHVLEIGTLFGLGLTAIYDHCVSRFDSVSLTAIDPLDGYYGTDVRDIITDEAICEATLCANLKIAGVSEDEYTLIKTLSTDASTIESTPKAFYDLLVIDGDHTYDGVKADYINYLACVRGGGYIIFDDYGTPEWPGIKEFVDESVIDNQDLTFIGAAWRSAVFQVTKQQPKVPGSIIEQVDKTTTV